MKQNKTISEVVVKEFKVKEDRFGNLIIHFIKDLTFKKGDNLFIYKPFKDENNT